MSHSQDNLLNIYQNSKQQSVISFLVADYWLVMIKTKTKDEEIDTNLSYEKNIWGERLKEIFYPTEYVNIEEAGINKVIDVKVILKDENYSAAVLWNMAHSKQHQNDANNTFKHQSRPLSVSLDIFDIKPIQKDQLTAKIEEEVTIYILTITFTIEKRRFPKHIQPQDLP